MSKPWVKRVTAQHSMSHLVNTSSFCASPSGNGTPRWNSLNTGAGPLRQVLDQTAEFKEDSGIYDALGCQAGHVGHVLATFFAVPWRIPQEGFPPAAQLRKRRSGPLSPCFVWDGLFAHLGLDCGSDCGSLWKKIWHCCGGFCMFLLGILGNMHWIALNRPLLHPVALFELRTTTSTWPWTRPHWHTLATWPPWLCDLMTFDAATISQDRPSRLSKSTWKSIRDAWRNCQTSGRVCYRYLMVGHDRWLVLNMDTYCWFHWRFPKIGKRPKSSSKSSIF